LTDFSVKPKAGLRWHARQFLSHLARWQGTEKRPGRKIRIGRPL